MKRRFSQLQDEPMLRLQLADDAPDKPPLEAPLVLLRASCSCARGLPQDSSVWDLSNLLIDNQPVSRDTVTDWLNVVYTLHEDVPFTEDAPAALTCPTRLYQLLTFADAVGSSRGVVKACLTGVDGLIFNVKVGDMSSVYPEVLLAAGGRHSWTQDNELVTCYVSSTFKHAAAADAAQKHAFTQQLVSQLEPLLYLAYRLNLGPLQEVLQAAISCWTHSKWGILYGHMRSVLTRRVLEAAADCDVGEEALLQLLVGQRGSVQGLEDSLFEPLDPNFRAPLMKFKAKVKRPLPGVKQGD